MATGCKKHGDVWQKLELADSLIEDRPDSSFTILKGISANDLNGNEEKAKYALLMSMALDKNYIDTTTFDVLQPAIDYYLKKGTPDEKLRTYYYQGRIYQNRGDVENAMNSYFKGSELSTQIKDSILLARTLIIQAYLYKRFYDISEYINKSIQAADIYSNLNKRELVFDSYLKSLNGYILLKDKTNADKILEILQDYENLNEKSNNTLNAYRLSYLTQFGNKNEIQSFLDTANLKGLDSDGLLSLAYAYNKIGDNNTSQHILDLLDNKGLKYDSIKYLAVKYLS